MEWQAYFYLKDRNEQIRTDEQSMAIIRGISHCIGGEGELDFAEMFPRYPFRDEEQDEETSVKSSEANVAKAFGVQPL